MLRYAPLGVGTFFPTEKQGKNEKENTTMNTTVKTALRAIGEFVFLVAVFATFIIASAAFD